jgi:aldose 1-epimerase
MTVPIMGNQYEIAAGDYRATITEVGGGLRELLHRSEPLVLSYQADTLAPAAMGQQLVPWPNRVDHGRYEFGDESHQLTITEAPNDNAIHGLVRLDNWAVAEHGTDLVRLTHRLHGRPGYPFVLDLSVTYALDAGLTVTMRAVNAGSRPAPYGHGAHPYITLGRPLDECLLTVSADHYLVSGDRSIPDGPPREVTGSPYDFRGPRPIGATQVDTAYTGLSRDDDGRAWIRLTDPDDGRTVGMWADEAHPWLQAFTADTVGPEYRRRGLGAEPMTCPPNAFVSGIDLVTLKPAETAAGTWGIVAGRA